MSPLLVVYCLLILFASLAGGWIPMVVRLTHRRMELAVSFVAGLMLGVGLLHLLPHAYRVVGPDGDPDQVVWSVLGGFLAMFFIERFFCFHHHDAPDEAEGGDHDHATCDHQHHHHHEHKLTWSGAAVGLTLHSVIAGVALAASVVAASHAERPTAIAGLGTFLVIFLHKPFDSLTLGTLMAKGGWSTTARHAVNAAFAMAIPFGAALYYVGIANMHSESNVLGCALAFSAGTFLCIAMSDLLPELQFHHHDRAGLSLALILGLTLATLIGWLEPEHHHNQQRQPADQVEMPIEEATARS